MYLSFLGSFIGILSFITIKLFSAVLNRRWLAAEISRQSCEPAPVLAKRDPFGLLRILDILRATKEERGPQYMGGLMNERGKDVRTV